MVQARLIGAVLLLFGLACGITSVAIDYWYYLNVTDESGDRVEVYFGLWEFCVKADGTSVLVCETWSDLEDRADGALDIDWLHGCQAMMIIGVFLNAAALIGTVATAIKHTTARVGQIGASIAGICYIIAVIIFGVKYLDSLSNNQKGGNLHAGFGLAIVAGIFNLISICLVGQGPAGAGYENM